MVEVGPRQFEVRLTTELLEGGGAKFRRHALEDAVGFAEEDVQQVVGVACVVLDGKMVA